MNICIEVNAFNVKIIELMKIMKLKHNDLSLIHNFPKLLENFIN